MNKTTVVCWFDISPEGHKNIRAVVRAIKEFSEGYTDSDGVKQTGFFEEMGVLRAEAYIRSGFEEGIRFAEHCGLGFEHRAFKYFGECPADVFVKFFDWNEA